MLNELQLTTHYTLENIYFEYHNDKEGPSKVLLSIIMPRNYQ